MQPRDILFSKVIPALLKQKTVEISFNSFPDDNKVVEAVVQQLSLYNIHLLISKDKKLLLLYKQLDLLLFDVKYK